MEDNKISFIHPDAFLPLVKLEDLYVQNIYTNIIL